MQELGLLVEPLEKQHNRNGFDCGVPDLNHWFQRTANQHKRKGISKTFVAVEPDQPKEVVGFFAMNGAEIDSRDLPPPFHKKLPDRVSSPYLGRLAVSVDHQGKGVGAFLLFEAIERAEEAIERIGGVGLLVHAKPNAIQFYEQFDFAQMADDPQHLFLRLPRAN